MAGVSASGDMSTVKLGDLRVDSTVREACMSAAGDLAAGNLAAGEVTRASYGMSRRVGVIDTAEHGGVDESAGAL